MMTSLVEQFKGARNAGAPFVSISCADPWAVLNALRNGETPKVVWDCVRGLRGMNDAGETAAGTAAGADLEATAIPLTALIAAAKLPPACVLFMLNLHRLIEDGGGAPPDLAIIQAISNLRDEFKSDGRTLVFLDPDFALPAELQHDVVTLDDPLPSDDQLAVIADETIKGAIAEWPKMPKPSADDLTRVVDAGRGLSAFSFESALAISTSERGGVDVAACWERKRKIVEQTDGLSFSIGGPTFAQVGGLIALKAQHARLFAGPQRPGAILRLDEGEKQLAGASGGNESSGVESDKLSVILREIEDHDATGMIAFGHPGCSKSYFSKTLGATYNVPTMEADLGATMSKWVGESQRGIRRLFKIANAVAGGRLYVVLTTNDLDSISGPLRSRMGMGTWFFDLPTDQEKVDIWKIQCKLYGIKKQDLPVDALWTGREIRNCCANAVRLGCSLVEAAQYIVPIATSDPEGVDRLRRQAHGRLLSVVTPGAYLRPKEEKETGRAFGAGR